MPELLVVKLVVAAFLLGGASGALIVVLWRHVRLPLGNLLFRNRYVRVHKRQKQQGSD